MTMSEILKHKEIEVPRAPSTLKAWVDAKCLELGATQEAKDYARSGGHLPKKFYDEVCPLSLFAWHEFGRREDVRVTPNLNNDNYDGIINISGQPSLFIEVTCAKDGHSDSLRMEVLHREGVVNAIAPIATVRGIRGSSKRYIKIPNEAVAHREILNHHLNYVRKCLKDKASKCYGKNHVLVVVVDDYMPFHSSGDEVVLDEAVRAALPLLSLDFSRIVILGAGGSLFLQYWIGETEDELVQKNIF